MSGLAWCSVAFGVLLLVSRGPLAFAPAATMRFYHGVVATPARVRVLGVVIGVLGLLVASTSWAGEGGAEQFFRGLGALFILLAVLLLVAPAAYQRIAEAVLSFSDESVDTAVVRGVGIFAMALGAFLIYLGLAVL